MKKAIIIISTLISFLLNGQENELNLINPSELDSIYVKALNIRFNLLQSTDWRFIQLNEYTQRISKLNVPDRYEFLTNEELKKVSINEQKPIQALSINHKIIETNTVDINFKYINIRGYSIMESVNDTDLYNYVPDMRFVFDRNKKEWIFISGRYKISTN